MRVMKNETGETLCSAIPMFISLPSTSLFGVPVPEIVTRHSGTGGSGTVTLSAGSLGLPVLYFYLLYSPFLWVLLMVISITITIKIVAMGTKMLLVS